MLYDAAEAEDVVSELFAELLRRLPEVETGREQAYLCESVRNRCRNVLARKTLTERVQEHFRRTMALEDVPVNVVVSEVSDAEPEKKHRVV